MSSAWLPVAGTADVAATVPGPIRVFAPVRGLPARAWIARTAAMTPSLVPAALTRRLGAPLGRPRRTTLAGAPAWSYAPVALARGGRLALTVQPLRSGVSLVGCQGPRCGGPPSRPARTASSQ